MIGLLDRFARPLLGLLDAENAHRLAVQGLRLVPRGPAPADDARLSMRVASFSQPGRPGGRFRQAWRKPDALLRLGFGCRGRHRDAAAAAGQSASPAVSAAWHQGVINRSASTARGEGGAGAAGGARQLRRSGRGHGGQQGQPRPHDYEPDRDLCAGGEPRQHRPNTPGLRDLQQGGCSASCSPAWSMPVRA